MVFFVGAYFGSRSPMELLVTWVFGTALAAAVGVICTSVASREG
jgi:hypothetical protein